MGKSTQIWRCPADNAMVKDRLGRTVPRVRSISMMNWVGGNGTDPAHPEGAWGAQWRVYRKTADFLDPGPSGTFVFLDERETSINDGFFVVNMSGYPGGATQMPDMPAAYHNNAGGLAFADGHSEIHKWVDPFTTKPVRKGESVGGGPSNNKDVRWMQDHATRAKR
jgi:prepilin-type processing-associated H-X9-DG protein